MFAVLAVSCRFLSVVQLIAGWFTLLALAEVCKFPAYLRRQQTNLQMHQSILQNTADEHPTAQWTTEIRYAAHSGHSGIGSPFAPPPQIQSQIDIAVLDREIIATVKFNVVCPPQQATSSGETKYPSPLTSSTSGAVCYQSEVIYRRECLSVADAAGGKFRVIHTAGPATYTTCIKFVRRNSNVVQVFVGPKESDNPEDVCSDHLLQRQEWPWIATVQQEWSFCPLSGGYDFRTFINRNREKLCPGEWRPSRLEAECVQGEGLKLTFPRHECSPLADGRTEIQLQCWASWKEDGYWFIIAASSPHKQPQYVLRFPLRLEDHPIRVHWYMSPICPVGKKGISIGHSGAGSPVDVVEVLMNKSEPGLCYDDSSQCIDYAREGRCTNSALYQYANYCKKSCGLCNLLPSPRAECRFPLDYHGEWYYYEVDRREKVIITDERVSFSSLGDFICKSKHWNINYYKLFSVYVNGCRPRYTCLHIERDSHDRIRFQLSISSSNDQSFDICVFKDDPEPLSSRIHSAGLKTLLPWSKMKQNSCGLDGVIRIFTHPDPERRTCWGSLTDWNQQRCGSEARLKLQLNGRCAATDAGRHFADEHATLTARPGFLQQEFTCTSYAKLDADLAILVTRSTISDSFSCWLIKTYQERELYAPWREVYQLPSSHCSTPYDLDDAALDNVVTLAMTTESDAAERPCGQIAIQKDMSVAAELNHGGRYTHHQRQQQQQQRGQPPHQQQNDDMTSYNNDVDYYVEDNDQQQNHHFPSIGDGGNHRNMRNEKFALVSDPHGHGIYSMPRTNNTNSPSRYSLADWISVVFRVLAAIVAILNQRVT